MSGGQRFKVTVTGVDQASPVIAKVNTAIGSLNKPVGDTQSGLRRLADSPALESLSKDLVKIGAGAKDAVGWIGSLIPSIGMLAGFGTAGGMAALANAWTSNAANIGRTAQAIGIGTTSLQLWQSAARFAGLTSEDLNSGLESLTTTMQDAVSGRNQEILGVMNQLGIRLHRTKDGAVDATSALMDLSAAFDATRRTHGVQSARNLANAFGVGNLIPLLLQGQEAIKKFQNEAARSGGIIKDEDTKRAIAFEQSLERLGLAAGGAGNRLGSILTPAITGATNAMASWLKNINDVLFALEKLPTSQTSKPGFRRAAVAATTGITPATAPVASGLLDIFGFAAEVGAGMGRDLGNWILGKNKPKSGAAATIPFTPTGAGWADRTPLGQLSSDELLAAARRDPIKTPHSGSVHVDVRLHGAPPGTVVTVNQSGDVEAQARVESSMPQYGP